MKIIHLIPKLNTIGGTERMVMNICKYQQLNHKVYIFTFVNKEEDENKPIKGLEIQNISGSKFQRRFLRENISEMESYNQKVIDIEPDIIHSHSAYTDLFLLNGKCVPSKVFIHLHLQRKLLRFNFNIKHVLDVIWYQRLIKKTDAKLIAVSKTQYDSMQKTCIQGKENILLLSNAIECKHFQNPKLKDSAVRFRLVAIGRLVKEKNHRFLVKIVKALKSTKNLSFTLDIYGDGPELMSLKDLITIEDLNDVIRLKGISNNPFKVLVKYDLLIQPSIVELFGLTVVEGFNCGLPAVVSNVGGLKDLVADGQDGFIIKSWNPKEWAVKINSLLEDQNKCIQFSNKAFEKSLQYDFPKYIKKLNSLYFSN